MYTYPSHYRYLFVVGVSVNSACVSVSMNTHDLFIKNWQVACILRSAGPATELESQCFSLSWKSGRHWCCHSKAIMSTTFSLTWGQYFFSYNPEAVEWSTLDQRWQSPLPVHPLELSFENILVDTTEWCLTTNLDTPIAQRLELQTNHHRNRLKATLMLVWTPLIPMSLGNLHFMFWRQDAKKMINKHKPKQEENLRAGKGSNVY